MPFRSRVSLALALAAATGCVPIMPPLRFTPRRETHRCDVPQPVVEAAPGPRVPLAVAVRHSTVPGAPADRTEAKDNVHTWIVAPAPPSRVLFERLASSAFERAVLEPEGAATGAPPAGSDAALDVRLGDVGFDWTPVGYGPYFARATYHVALRGADGAPVTEFDVEGVGSRAPVYIAALTECPGIGDAVALAMQDAGAKTLARLSSDPALAAWLRTRGAAAPALAVRPAADYPAPPPPPPPDALAASGGSPADAGPPPPPRPVTAPAPSGPAARRSAYWSGAIGGFAPEETAGKLEGPGTGLSLFIEGEARFNRYVGLAAEGGWLYRSFSRALVAPGMKGHLELETGSLGLGPRVFLPAEVVEPWIGVMPCVLLTRASELALIGLNERPTEWSAGLLFGAGLRLHPYGQLVLGLEVRRLLASASLGSYPGEAGIGGWTFGVSLGAAVPP
jgi:hypothetical protein